MRRTAQIPPTTANVEIVAFPDVQLLDVAGPLQVFESANLAATASGRPPPYRTRVVARETPVRSSAGVSLLCAGLPSAATPVDTLVVAGGRGVHRAAADGHLVRWLTARSRRARRTVSICSGAFLLGACGLLDGRRVVTHWIDCAALAEEFPAARVETDPIFVEDGALWTSAGVTAGIDLALALVERDLGHATAMTIARDLVVFLKRPGGQDQFSAFLRLQTGDERFDRLHGWIAGHLDDDLSVAALARRVGMSERSFVRHYGKTNGVSPARAIERIRIEAAGDLLRTTRLPIKRVAQRCGFGSEETMRRSFLRQVAVTPQHYRERFAAMPVRPG
ncbi:MAG: GlxA family transcriptional regulator [Alphaproteobacteria bacterium]|nr:GlxA family transcriptional regulator [Alphaproteobacteria bacterium]